MSNKTIVVLALMTGSPGTRLRNTTMLNSHPASPRPPTIVEKIPPPKHIRRAITRPAGSAMSHTCGRFIRLCTLRIVHVPTSLRVARVFSLDCGHCHPGGEH